MNLLVTGAFSCSPEQLKSLEDMGNKIFFMQNESENLPCSYDTVEGVICNGLFLHHPIENFTSLKFIQLTSAGFDRVPMEYIKEKGIKIFNAKGVYSVPMAEFALCGVLCLYKQMNFFKKNQSAHKWYKHRGLLELFGKTVLIIGCGNVGNECAKRFNAFGCRVLGADIEAMVDKNYSKIFPISGLKVALKESDIVVLTLPLTNETKYIINEDTFSFFKKNAILVNIARGAVVDTNALIKALNSNLGGAVLDVFEDEPLIQSSPLWDMENVIITPHNSFVGEGNIFRLFSVIKSNLESIL